MNAKEAAKKICEELKGLEVLGCYEYDSNYYLFSMTPKGIITNEDNYYLFNKFTYNITRIPRQKAFQKVAYFTLLFDKKGLL